MTTDTQHCRRSGSTDELRDRVVIITGAGRGIGRQEALYAAAHGARVVVNDPGVATDGTAPDDTVAAEVVEEIQAEGGHAVANTDSVADWAGAERIIDCAVQEFGDLHVVVNNAAIEQNQTLLALTADAFDSVVAVKLRGTTAVSHWAARYWRRQHDEGRRVDRSIVNTASGSGLLNPLPTQSNYAAANAGVAALTIVHALELNAIGVRVNCLSPSMARTRLTTDVVGMPSAPEHGFDVGNPRVIAPVMAW